MSCCALCQSLVLSLGARRSIARCAMKFPAEVERLKILGLLPLGSPMSLSLFTGPSSFTVTLNSPVEVCWLQIIVVLDGIVAEVLLKVPLSTKFASPRPQPARIRLPQACTAFWSLPSKALMPQTHSTAKRWVPGCNNWASIALLFLQRTESSHCGNDKPLTNTTTHEHHHSRTPPLTNIFINKPPHPRIIINADSEFDHS